MTQIRLHELLRGQDLTGREIEVLRHASYGATSRETGVAIELATETVRHYRKTLCAKLEARNMAHAVSRGFQTGYLTTLGVN